MSVIFLGLPNFSALDYVTVATTGASGLEPALMGASRLKTEEPTERARLTTLDPQHTQWAFSTSGVPVSPIGFHIINHNLAGGGQLRVIGNFLGSVVNAPSILLPNAILDSSNMTGVVGSIDEDIYTPDGNVIGPTTASSAWTVRLGFPTPGAQPLGGSNMMCWVFRVRRIAGSSLVYYPVVWASLYENGSLVRALGWRAVTESASGGQIFIFPFSLSELANQTCANIEVLLSFTPGSGTGGQHAVLESLALYYETVALSKDTGWFTVVEDDRQGPALRKKDYPIAVEGWDDLLGYTVMFRSDQSVHNPSLVVIDDFDEVPSGVIARLPKSFVQAGVVNAGDGVVCSEGIDHKHKSRANVEVMDVTGETGSGRTYGTDAWRRIKADGMTFYLTESELDTLRDQLPLRRGHTGAFSLILNPDSLRQTDSIWCTLREFGEPEWIGVEGGVDYYAVSMSFEEKL